MATSDALEGLTERGAKRGRIFLLLRNVKSRRIGISEISLRTTRPGSRHLSIQFPQNLIPRGSILVEDPGQRKNTMLDVSRIFEGESRIHETKKRSWIGEE